MKALLVLLVFFTLDVSGCPIEWAKCDKATCFSKYAKREGLGLYAKTVPGQAAPNPDPTVGLFLLKTSASSTTVGILVSAPGMQDEDWAAVTVGKKKLAGCHKGTRDLSIAEEMGAKLLNPARSYASNVFCCKVDVEHLNIEFLSVSSALPLAINWTIGVNRDNIASLATDFSASVILDSLEYREKVTCDISSFRTENASAEARLYYPLQDPAWGRCDVENHVVKIHDGADYDVGEYLPACNAEGKWTIEGKTKDFSKFPPLCYQLEFGKQRRRSCAGSAPPAEILCGKKCAPMDPRYFKCDRNGSYLHVLNDKSTSWTKAEGLVCTDRGFVAKLSNDESLLLSSEAKVQCKVTNPTDPLISFLSYSRAVALLLGAVIYLVIFSGVMFGCHVLFSKMEAQVKKMGPIRGRNHGPVLSSRQNRTGNSRVSHGHADKDESNRNVVASNRTIQSDRQDK